MKHFLLYFLKLVLVITGIALGIASICLAWINYPTSPLAVTATVFFAFALVGSWETIRRLLKSDE